MKGRAKTTHAEYGVLLVYPNTDLPLKRIQVQW